MDSGQTAASFELPKRELLGKFGDETGVYIEGMKKMMAAIKVEDMLVTPENVETIRAQWRPAITYSMAKEKEKYEALAEKVDVTVSEMKVTDGTSIKLFVNRPKAIADDKTAPIIIWARGGMCTIFDAETMQPYLIDMADFMNCVVI